MKLIEGEKYICITDNFYPIGEIVVYEKSFDADIFDGDNVLFRIQEKGIRIMVKYDNYDWDKDIMLYKDYLRIQKIERILGNE
jgi:hypothetical protein